MQRLRETAKWAFEQFKFNGQSTSHIDTLDELIQQLQEGPFPGRSVMFLVQKAGLKSGAQFTGRATKTGRVYLDLQETAVAHIHADFCQEVPKGKAQLDLCMLRYDALRLVLDGIKQEPTLSASQAIEEARRIFDEFRNIYQQYPDIKTLYMHPYTDSLRLFFQIDDNQISYRHAP